MMSWKHENDGSIDRRTPALPGQGGGLRDVCGEGPVPMSERDS